jgi:ribonuclease-3
VNVDVLSNRLGVDIEPQLLELALTHRSYAYENGNTPNNERLEFLGDSVLGFVVTAHIHDLLTDLPEGELTKVKNAVVSATALSQVATSIGLGEFLRLGKGEDQTGGREKPNLLADAFEAILGAAYVSQGLQAAEGIIRKLVFPLLEDTDSLRANSDPKTTLGEFAQAHLRPVHLNQNVFDQRCGRLARAHSGEFVNHDLLGLDHLLFRFQKNVIDGHSCREPSKATAGNNPQCSPRGAGCLGRFARGN